jgi:hypothetical protein
VGAVANYITDGDIRALLHLRLHAFVNLAVSDELQSTYALGIALRGGKVQIVWDCLQVIIAYCEIMYFVTLLHARLNFVNNTQGSQNSQHLGPIDAASSEQLCVPAHHVTVFRCKKKMD